MNVKSESEVVQSCPTLCDPMDCNPPSSSTHGIFHARVLEWGAIAFSKLAGGTFSNMVPLVSISQGHNYIDCANTGEGQLGHLLFGISVVSAQTPLRRPARTTDGAGLGFSCILASQLAWQFPVHLFLVSAQEVSRAT